MEKMTRGERAKQFMPFAALHGYYDAVSEKEKIITEKRELTEEELCALNEEICKITKGSLVEITYYNNDGYITVSGAVSQIDTVLRKITVIKTQINFDDISRIKVK